MVNLSEQVSSEGKKHDSCLIDIVRDQRVVAARGKLSSCCILVCLMSLWSDYRRGKQIRWAMRKVWCLSNGDVDGDSVG